MSFSQVFFSGIFWMKRASEETPFIERIIESGEISAGTGYR